MAIMVPDNITYYNFTESEKVVYNALKTLDDNYTVFYSVPWQEKTNAGNFKFNGECDFIIENKNIGFISLEVKGGINLKIDDRDWFLYLSNREKNDGDDYGSTDNQYVRKLKRSPIQQAEKSMFYFLDLFNDTYRHKFSGIFGHAVCFPNFLMPNNLGPNGPKEIIIDTSSIKNIKQKIEDIFSYYAGDRNRNYKMQDHSDFINLISLKRQYMITKGSIIRNKSEIFETINHAQDLYLSMIREYKKACINGGAGTGKTFCAIKKALEFSAKNKKTLFLSFNKLLAEHINLYFFSDLENITCLNFHEFIKLIIGKTEFSKLFSRTSGKLSGITKEIKKDIYRIPKYDAVIIDEGQDFDSEWYRSIQMFMKNAEEAFLYVFYDKNQDIFSGGLNRFTEILQQPPFHLVENLRNCSAIQKWTTNQTNLGKDVIPNQIEGIKPIVYEASDKEQVENTLKSILKNLTENELIESNQIIIISDRTHENCILKSKQTIGTFKLAQNPIQCDLSTKTIRFHTVQSFKGLESDVVIYMQHNNNSSKENNMLNYVAYSRARFILYLIKCKVE